jgi:hypothetical protein
MEEHAAKATHSTLKMLIQAVCLRRCFSQEPRAAGTVASIIPVIGRKCRTAP